LDPPTPVLEKNFSGLAEQDFHEMDVLPVTNHLCQSIEENKALTLTSVMTSSTPGLLTHCYTGSGKQ